MTTSTTRATSAYLGALGSVVAGILLLAPAAAPAQPDPPKWDEIPVCLDCGRLAV